MESIYKTALHQFVEEFFKVKQAEIEIIDCNYFNVKKSDGTIERYTYNPKIAAENKSVTLIAKGSRALVEMINETKQKGSFSQVAMTYSLNSVKKTLSHKDCCGLCPFTSVCEYKNGCCDFCSNYKVCNSTILNAEFEKLGEVIETIPLKTIAFLFTVEITNDYLLSQRTQKNIAVLIDLETGEPLEKIVINDLEMLDINPVEEGIQLDFETFSSYQKKAIEILSEDLTPQLELFKQQIEEPLKNKIQSIIRKYREDYLDAFTKLPPDKLEEMQQEALNYCNREIRGYGINCDYKLNSVILVHTSKDKRKIVYKLNNIDKNVEVDADLFLNKIDMTCIECGIEIDKAYICPEGHLVCNTCADVCKACGKVLCQACGEDGYICSTCGETLCEDCVSRCETCGATVCSEHIYECCVCSKKVCIDCYEICSECGRDICIEHTENCSSCGAFVCPEHSYACAVCGKKLCSEHSKQCCICGKLHCSQHSLVSAYSERTVCTTHSSVCKECGRIFAEDEVRQCTFCDVELCPDHQINCYNCNKVYCLEHVRHCPDCGKHYCECTKFEVCRLCGQSFCPDCVNTQGYCNICLRLEKVDTQNSELKMYFDLIPGLASYKSFRMAGSESLKVIFAESFLKGVIIVLDKKGAILEHRELTLLEKYKIKISRKVKA